MAQQASDKIGEDPAQRRLFLLRVVVAALTAATVFLVHVLSGSGDLAGALFLLTFVVGCLLVYVNLATSVLGSLLIGLALVVTVMWSELWAIRNLDDGFEFLAVVVNPYLVLALGLLLEFAVFRRLEHARDR